MGNSGSTARQGSVNRQQWFSDAPGPGVADERAITHSHVFSVAPVATEKRDADSEQPSAPPAPELSEADEHEFWEATPRYSVTNLPSLAPPPVAPAPAPWRIWAARALFALILCATVALLGLEIKALAAQDEPPAQHSQQ